VKWIRKLFRGLLFLFGLIVFGLLIFAIYLYNISDIQPPEIKDQSILKVERIQSDSLRYQIGANFLQQNKYGLFEMYLEGADFERGAIYGKLAKELIRYQEQAFTDEIQRMIPSKNYLRFLKYIVGFMNRNLSDYVIPEYQNEIYGISLAASDEFNWIGTNYSRQLNYHAAHDIGHALANLMLVGCTSFATWNDRSKDSLLTVGRNFDFYVGDDFAKNKIVAFYNPDNGIPFMSVTWGGFAGVVSGMNTKGLTVTINANKSSIPSGAATPVSLVAREILQYASNISEAIAIAKKRKMFVSESFLISSASDNRAVVIEKTPDDLDVYESAGNEILCANHYQSKLLAAQELNQTQIKQSASLYRYERLQQLLHQTKRNTPQRTAEILRDYRGQNNADIGLTNEKALNQFISHHSIIFQPQKLLVWISTSPWQLGSYVCYDLNTIFRSSKPTPLYVETFNISPDSILKTSIYTNIREYLALEKMHLSHKPFNPQSIIKANPNYYDSYRIAGDIYSELEKKDSAIVMYKKALTLEIATQDEKESISKKVLKLQKK
jgi:isopenicillin-N N-acyltransferase-like protein